jgi:hypothetical protein
MAQQEHSQKFHQKKGGKNIPYLEGGGEGAVVQDLTKKIYSMLSFSILGPLAVLLFYCTSVLYPPRVIPYGIHGMEGGFHEMSDGFHGISDGFHTISRWIPWNGRWIPYLFQMDSIPFPGWSPYGIHVISSWNHNFTLVPHHFQSGFHMDSIWNQLKYI